MKEREYAGWKNYETWNVALWLRNDESLSEIARRAGTYRRFVVAVWDAGRPSGTPDGVCWLNPRLDKAALNRVCREG